MSKLNSIQRAFFNEVREILWSEWDPIGVNDGDNEQNDEYDSYAASIFRLALEGKDAMTIAMSMSSSSEKNMGLSPARAHDLKIANIILTAKNKYVGL